MNKKVLSITGLIVVIISVMVIVLMVNNKPIEMGAEEIKQMVQDYSLGNINAQNASINSNELVVTENDGKESSYKLPEEEFFVSVAPYLENTHPCAIHSLTSCRGEMVEQEFKVLIEDLEGNILIDQTMKSLPNGFIDLWLPKNGKFKMTIEQDGKSAVQEISTFEGDNTCITTMQLA